MRHRALRTFLLAVLLLSGWHVKAGAQIASGGSDRLFRSDAAGTRVEPEFDPKPFRVGSFLAEVRLSEETRLETNVLNTRTNTRSDVSLSLEPVVAVRTDWNRHLLTLLTRARMQRYNNVTSENRTAYEARLGARFDAERGSEFMSSIRYTREAEDRGFGGSNQAGEPAFLKLLDARTSVRTDIAGIQLDASIDAEERRYEDIRAGAGMRVDQSFRDIRSVSLNPRVNVPSGAYTVVFATARVSRSESIDPRPSRKRDATGTAVLAGIRFEGPGLLAAEAGFGWRTRNYDSVRFRDYEGATWDIAVDGYPTQLTSFRLQAGQDFRNSGLAEVPAILVRTYSFAGYYDMKRNLRLKLSLDLDRERYREIGLTTATVTTTLVGSYTLSPRIGASLYLRYRDRSSSDANRVEPYSGITLGASLTGWL